MTSCLENIQIPSCIWFESDEKRNSLMSMLAGTLFFTGWWFLIDAHATYPNEMYNAYYLCGIFGTISLFMINSVTNAQIRGDGFSSGYLGSRGAKGWLFIGFFIGFVSVIVASWILFADFGSKESKSHWPTIGLFLQNIFIFLGSLTYKFGRSEDQWA